MEKIPPHQPSVRYLENIPDVPTKYLYDSHQINFPYQLLYHDYICTIPKEDLHLNHWVLNNNMLDIVSVKHRYMKSLYLNYCRGLSAISDFEKLRGMSFLTIVHMRNVMILTAEVVKLITTWPKLSELDISENRVEPNALAPLALGGCSLRVLICENCPGLDDFALTSIANCMERHRKLNIVRMAHNSDCSDDGILVLTRPGCNYLSELDISNCKNLTTLAVAGLRKKMIKLKLLNLRCLNINQSAFEWITEGGWFIVKLNLSKCTELSDVNLILLGKKCRNIKCLDISGCINVSDTGISGFCSEHTTRLEELNISHCMLCTEISAIALSKVSNQLTSLKMNCLSQISEDGISKLWHSLKNIEYFEMCTDIRNSGTHRKSIIPHISDKAVVTGQFQSLIEVKLIGACLISDIGACWIAENCPKLEVLDISYCNKVTNKLLFTLARYSQNLRGLGLSGLPYVTDDGFKELVKGCNGLVKLECHGCHALRDEGVKAIATLPMLEYLNIGSCDDVTDVSIISLSGCKHLKYLDISGLDSVTAASIKHVAKNCLNLIRFSAISCNILSHDFHKLCKFLPYSQPSLSKCKLESRKDDIVAYNHFITKIHLHYKCCILIQKYMRRHVCMEKYKKILKHRKYSAREIQRVYRGVLGRRKVVKRKQELLARDNQVKSVQAAMRRLSAIKFAKAKLHHYKQVYHSTITLQRITRGYFCRKRLFWYFKDYIRRSKFFYISQKLFVIHKARELHRHIINVQRVLRGFVCRRKYKKFHKGIKLLQRGVRIKCAMSKATSIILEELISNNYIIEYAAFVIQRFLVSKYHNAMIIKFVLFCAMTYRNEVDQLKWHAICREQSATRIQALYRGYRCRYLQYKLNLARTTGYNAVLKVQSFIRMIVVRKKYAAFRGFKKKITARWRRFYLYELDQHYGKFALPIQRRVRLFQFNKARKMAAGLLQRSYRGYVGRLKANVARQILRNKMASKIQWKMRYYMERKRKKFEFARKYIAARRIQVAARKRIAFVARGRVALAIRERENQERIHEKLKLLNDKRLKIVDRIKNTTLQRSAIKIQRTWRKYKKEADRKREALANKKAMLQEFVNKRSRFDEGKEKLKAALRIPNPVNAAINFARMLDRVLNESSVVEDSEKPKFLASILNYQTLSIQQTGIIDIAMTYGDSETNVFRERQAFYRGTKRRYFVEVVGDLSGYLDLGIKLWVMYGKGTECICKLMCKEKPPKSSIAALKARCSHLRIDGVNLAWNEHVHVEIHGICLLKQKKSGFAIDAIKICHTPEEAVAAKKSGFKLVQDLMKYNLPTSLWFHSKAEVDEQITTSAFKFEKIETFDWFDERLQKCCQKFFLEESDVLTIRHTFETILAGSHSFEISTASMFAYMKLPYTTVCEWIVSAVTPRDMKRLSFSEYVHIICYWCSFGLQERIRFIFGQMCDERSQTITRAQFELIIVYLTEGFEGHKNVLKWQRSWDSYCNKNLQLMFISDFEAFVNSHFRVFWGVNLIQTAFMNHNISRHYWELKVEKYNAVRTNLGLTKI